MAGAVATTVSLAGLLLFVAGRENFLSLLPAWAVLWLIIPPPLGVDAWIVDRTNGLSAHASSLILDAFSVQNLAHESNLLLQGLTFSAGGVAGRTLSPFAFFAVSAVFIVGTRRPVSSAILMLACSAFWAVAMNIGVHGDSRRAAEVGRSGLVVRLEGRTPGSGPLRSRSVDDGMHGVRRVFPLAPVPIPNDAEIRNPLSLFWNRVVADMALCDDPELYVTVVDQDPE